MPASITPLNRTNLADDIAQRLRAFIRDQSLKAGDRLPAIAALATSFGVGAPTVREALKTLEAVGIVDIRHGSGTFVGRADDALVISNPVFLGTASKRLLLDLVAARRPIEVLSAQLAAQHATRTHLRELGQLLARAEAHISDDTILNETNLAFHRQIAASSGNTVVRQLLEVLTNTFAAEQRMILNIQDRRQEDHDEHRGILFALEQHNAALAARRMAAHLANVERMIRRWNPARSPLVTASLTPAPFPPSHSRAS